MCLSASVYHFLYFLRGGAGVSLHVLYFLFWGWWGKVIHYLVNYYFLGGRVSLQVLLYFGGGGWGESDTLLLLFFFLGGVFDFLKFFVLVLCVCWNFIFGVKHSFTHSHSFFMFLWEV